MGHMAGYREFTLGTLNPDPSSGKGESHWALVSFDGRGVVGEGSREV